MTSTLPPKNDSEGCETRLLLAECRSPAGSGYTLAEAKECMQLMDLVLWNRMDNPAPFGAKGAKTIADIVRAPGQFAGFEHYPKYASSIIQRIQSVIDIANSKRDSRSAAYTDHIQAALDVTADPTIKDPTTGVLASWRTAGSGSPGGNFKLHKTLLGVTFYFIP